MPTTWPAPVARAAVAAAAALLTVTLAGCGEYPGVPHPQALSLTQQASSPPTPSQPRPSAETGVTLQPGPGSALAEPSPAPAALAEPTSTPSPTPVPLRAELALKDFYLEPEVVVVAAGEVTFVLHNQGRYIHDFRIEGPGMEVRSPRISAGRSLEWSVELQPGTYRISCPISNHADRGMVGTLTVTPGS